MLKSLLKHLQAILLLPTVMTIVIPISILSGPKSANIGWALAFPLNLLPTFFGLAFIGVGLALVIKTNMLFATIGKGTLAPWTPTQKLVVRGIYRHVRNPMISGVFCILLGEASLFGSPNLFTWFMIFLLINVTYIPLFEEPGLERRFGQDYLVYKKNVPRWIPRRTPWDAPSE